MLKAPLNSNQSSDENYEMMQKVFLYTT